MKAAETDRLRIFDTTLRDGEQSPGVSLSATQKVEIARALDQLGVDVIEAGFPAASPGDADAVRQVAATIARASVCALARCHEGDIRLATDAVKLASSPRIHVFIATSPIHRKFKLRMSTSQVMSKAKRGIETAVQLCRDVEFSAEDATRTEPEFLADIVAAAAGAGARTINIPDTVGYTTPKELARIIERVARVLRDFPETCISVHCHDDLGMATANSLAGIQSGARQVECTINGIGERAGNAALEEVVMAVRTRADIWPLVTSIETRRLIETSRLVARHTGFKVPPNKAIVGDNAFAHESGIHQHGVLGNTQAYEIIQAEAVGARTSLVLGKHSGRHAFEDWLSKRGIQLEREAVNRAFNEFKRRADREGTVTDEQILSIADNCAEEGSWKVEDVSCIARVSRWEIAVRLVDNKGRRRHGSGTGGMLEAAMNAVAEATRCKMEITGCTSGLHARGDGTQASATVTINVYGIARSATGVAPTEGEAVVYAIVDALPGPESSGREVKESVR